MRRSQAICFHGPPNEPIPHNIHSANILAGSASGVFFSKMSFERSSFRRNFQGWVELNYGENSRTKTITRKKFNKICRYLLGEPQIETDAKFRFWVKSKGFRIAQAEDSPDYGVLYVPVKVPHTRVSPIIAQRFHTQNIWLSTVLFAFISDCVLWDVLCI